MLYTYSRQLLNFFSINAKSPTTILEDDASCIAVTKNPINHKATRQMDTKLYFVRDEIRKTILIRYVQSENNEADLLTTPLPIQTLKILCLKIGLLS